MANPIITAVVDKTVPYVPDEAITLSWTVDDPDDDVEELTLTGVDALGREVTVEQTITRRDPFTMTRVFWDRTDDDLVIDNAAQTAVGTVPVT